MPERQLTFVSDGFALAGSLLAPEGETREIAAVLVTGSGPLDRDANTKRQPLGVSRHLAAHLHAAGIGTLRYDKRGIGESEGSYKRSGFHDNVTDAAAAVAALREQLGGRKIVAIGHSEGALIATRLAAGAADVDGAVLLACPARSGRDTMRFQLEILPQMVSRPISLLLRLFRTSVTKMQLKQMARLERSSGDTMRVQLSRVNAKWFREFLAYDPRHDFRSIDAPLLAITGEKDIQVPVDDLPVIAELAAGSVEVYAPENLTHTLRRDPSTPTLRSYRAQMREPTDAEVLRIVESWMLRLDEGTL